MEKNKVLVLGVVGMLGHTVFYELSGRSDLDVSGTVRNAEEFKTIEKVFEPDLVKKITSGADAGSFEDINKIIEDIRPGVVINCIGLIKQAPTGKDPLLNITLNAQFPHKIADICKHIGARMIHISTDCVFDGKKGNYSEDDAPTATDYYGMTKYLGEVLYPHCVTVRTSIIGHELATSLALVDWFLGEHDTTRGFTKAIYTGLPTVELARVIYEFVIPNPDLGGLFHVSADPISKYELLTLIAKQYAKDIEIEPFDGFACDRSLDSSLFRKKTGYAPPKWPELVAKMHAHYVESGLYKKPVR